MILPKVIRRRLPILSTCTSKRSLMIESSAGSHFSDARLRVHSQAVDFRMQKPWAYGLTHHLNEHSLGNIKISSHRSCTLTRVSRGKTTSFSLKRFPALQQHEDYFVQRNPTFATNQGAVLWEGTYVMSYTGTRLKRVEKKLCVCAFTS